MNTDKFNLVLLSGGSGVRLWPLSNGVRSKQFLELLPSPNGGRESMAQRISRQIAESGLNASITVSTNRIQRDNIEDQIGSTVDNIVVEPERRDTFPAIALAAAFLLFEKNASPDDVVAVMPIDPFTESDYFAKIAEAVEVVRSGAADLALLGVEPHYASSKFGYIVPQTADRGGTFRMVSHFEEKPQKGKAEQLIGNGAFWNAGVFVFRLGYVKKIAEKYVQAKSFEDFRNKYAQLPKISFDYEVVEKAESVAVVPYSGVWKDLGTWNSLTEEMPAKITGNAIAEDSPNTHIVNELGIPIICLGVENSVVAASPDGILVGAKERVEELKKHAGNVKLRPMFERRRWGGYKVVAFDNYDDGRKSLTKVLKLDDGANISYQKHEFRDEIWTCVNGEGFIVLDGEKRRFQAGDVVKIRAGQKHAIKAVRNLQIIEVQIGSILTEDDIQRFDFKF